MGTPPSSKYHSFNGFTCLFSLNSQYFIEQSSSLQPTSKERIGRGGRNLWVQYVNLTSPMFQSVALFLYSNGPVSSTSRASVALLLLLLSRFSCVWLCATPWTAAYQAPPSMGFSRQQYWSGVPLPPVALLICKSVPLLPEIRKSRPSKHNFNLPLRASLVTQRLKNPPAMQETLVQFLVRKICWRRDRLSTPWVSMVAQLVKNPSTVQETWVSHCPL